jgi:hypothetical protein
MCVVVCYVLLLFVMCVCDLCDVCDVCAKDNSRVQEMGSRREQTKRYFPNATDCMHSLVVL